MLKTYLTRILPVAPFCLLANQAHAHPGSHAGMDTGELLHHLFSNPFHVVIGAGVALLLAGLVFWLAKRHSSR